MTIPKINSSHGAETRNLINRVIEVVNTQGKTIQDLVAEGQLTEEQYTELITVINGHLKSGEVNRDDLHANLKVEIDKIQNKIDKGEVSVHDIDINQGKLLPRHLSEEVLRMMTGDAPINAVPADGSITREKLAPNAVGEHQTSFISTNNLWDGLHHRYIYLQSSADVVRHTVSGDPRTSHYSAIVRVEPGETYTILKKEGGDRFNIAVLGKLPELEEDEHALLAYGGSNDGSAQSRAITIPEGGRLLVIHTNTYTEDLPDIIVSQGATAAEDEKLKFNKEIEGYPKLVNSNKNLFDGDYKNLDIFYIPSTQIMQVRYAEAGRVAIIKVNANTKYSISLPNKDHDRFRVVGFDHDPSVDSVGTETILVGLTQDFNPNENVLTFETGPDTDYIAIYVSASSAEPALQLELGDPTDYEPSQFIDPRFLHLPKNNGEVTSSKRNGKFNFYENLDVLYIHNPIEDYFSNPTELTAEQFNNLYRDLESAHPDKIDVEVAGVDDWGNELLKVETKVIDYNWVESGSGNPGTEGEPINQPKFVITTGVHGHEKSATYATYYFLKELLNTDRDLLKFVLDNIKLVIMPLCNPSGFNNNQRRNGNDVDLNRNFYSSSNEQKETKIIKDVLNSHRDMDFYIDYHTLIPRGTIIGYTVTNHDGIARTINNMYRSIGTHWQKINPDMPQGREVIFSFTTPAKLGGLIVEYAEGEYGVDSVVLELTNAYSYLADGNYSEPVVRIGVEALTNSITGLLRLRQ